MPTVEIYTKSTCGYCTMAKRLLKSKNVSFSEFPVAGDPAKLEEMIKRSNGGRTVPQIFINDQHIGGFDDISALDMVGKLDPLLAA